MPKQIKKEKIKPFDCAYRKTAVAALITALVFIGAMVWEVLLLTKDNGALLDSNPVPTAVFAGAFLLYLVGSLVSIGCGVKAYNREDNFTVLFQVICLCVTVIFCIMNLKMVSIMTLSAFHLDNAVQKLLGSQSQTEYINGQFKNWVLLIGGTFITLVIGILAIVKLVSNKSKK